MSTLTLRDQLIDEHISKNYPNAKIVNYDDDDCDLKFYSAEELHQLDADWFPLSCYKDKSTGRAMYGGREGIYHTYTEGETGAGKTTRFVMQAIYALSSMKNKPSFLIVDNHGEIIENLYTHLKNDYDIKIINCDNPQRSDTYNPFKGLIRDTIKTGSLSDDTINGIRRISEIIQPVEATNDPIWDQGARSYTNGCILDKFEDLINGDIPEDCMTLYNILQNHYWLRDKLNHSGGYGVQDLFSIPHYRQKGTESLSAQKMISVTNNAEKTRASYFGVVENHYDAFGQPSLYSLCSNSTIDIDEAIDKPTAIVIQSGSTKIADDLISLLVVEIYNTVVKRGKESKSKKLPRNFHCFLDEFANCNIADGPEFIKMLTTSRKFGMFWHMFLQCDAQLERKYDADIGRIIRANCTEIFMGSHDFNTVVRFADSCGYTTIESLLSRLEQKTPMFEKVSLVTPDKLFLMEKGYAYIKSNRYPLTKTYIEAFYNCDEFSSVKDINSIYPDNTFDYTKTVFVPDDIAPKISSREWRILKYLKPRIRSLEDVKKRFSSFDVKPLLKSMTIKGIIELMDDHFISANITDRQFRLYEYRESVGAHSEKLASTQNTVKTVYQSTSNQTKKAMSLADIDKWLSEESETKERKKNVSPEELIAHFKRIDIDAEIRKVAHLKIIPSFLLDAMENYSLFNSSKAVSDILSGNLAHLKFDIVESFIERNEFSAKEQWIDRIEIEMRCLKKTNAFPESFMDEFDNALKIMQEFSLDEIMQLKDILDN